MLEPATFLLTDVEGSSALWSRFGEQMLDVIGTHDRLITEVVEASGGTVFKDTGDGLWARFEDAGLAIDASVQAQIRLASQRWGDNLELRVRMGLHAGSAHARPNDYCGEVINETARVAAAAHGGQIIATRAVINSVTNSPADVSTLLLGEYRLRDIPDRIAIFQIEHPQLPTQFEPLRTVTQETEPLRTPAGRFVGRVAEINAIEARLPTARALTISGGGGIGKTRLALEVANRSRHRYVGGSRICELGSVASADVQPAVLEALGIFRRSSTDSLGVIVDWLNARPHLLVLDGCDDVAVEATRVIDVIRERCPDAAVLATSRAPLGFAGEFVLTVPPLAIDATSGGPAVELFVDRVTTADVTRTIAPAELDDVAQICRTLDGLPLAIEIFASRTTQRTTAELRAEAHDLLDLTMPTQRRVTLREVVSSSLDHVSDDACDMLMSMSVFTGWFTRSDITDVIGLTRPDQVDAPLVELITSSLLTRRTDGPETRYRVFEPIRQLGREKLGELGQSEELRNRHTRRTIDAAVSAAKDARGRNELAAIGRFEDVYPDLRVAVDRIREMGDLASWSRLIRGTWDFAVLHPQEGFWDWPDMFIEVSGRRSDDVPEILGIAGLAAWIRGDRRRASALAQEALTLETELGCEPTLPPRLVAMNTDWYAGRETDLLRLGNELFMISEQLGEAYWGVSSRTTLAIGAAIAGAYDDAERLATSARRRARECGNASSLAWALFGCGMAIESTDAVRAEAFVDESLRIARSIRNRWVTSMSLALLSTLRRRTSGPRSAAPILLQLLDDWSRDGNIAQLGYTVRECGMAVLAAGHLETGLTLCLWSETTRLRMPQLVADAAAFDKDVERATNLLEADQVARARVSAETRRLDEVIAAARTAVHELIG